ncbi:MAG: hypothetical protein KJ793_00460, partial [Candidatus Omnitrophica bacterium]|nr:hypothetical protein [Candidatus Omnitrophota bacterium]
MWQARVEALSAAESLAQIENNIEQLKEKQDELSQIKVNTNIIEYILTADKLQKAIAKAKVERLDKGLRLREKLQRLLYIKPEWNLSKGEIEILGKVKSIMQDYQGYITTDSQTQKEIYRLSVNLGLLGFIQNKDAFEKILKRTEVTDKKGIKG